jgi:hypothetical protein
MFMTGCDKRSVEVSTYDVTLILSSNTMVADNDNTTFVLATAKVTNPATGADIPDIPVSFSVTNGNASLANPNTDESGTASVQIYDHGKTGNIVVTATVGASKAEQTITTMENTGFTIHKITANPEFIYSDNNVTYSTIKVIVRDSDNFPAAGKQVRFQTTAGTIDYASNTDTTGVATVLFWDSGDPAQEVLISAYVDNVVDTISVEIKDSPDIGSISLNINSDNLNVTESTEISSTVTDELGNEVPDGTSIIFTADYGFFVDSDGVDIGQSIASNTSNGKAKVRFNSGISSGVAHITASIGGETASGNINIYPGIARYIYLSSNPSEVLVNSDGSLISAAVEDFYHNSVREGISVNFTTNVGSISPIATTDNNGQCSVEFSPGTSAGFAEITATVGDSATATSVVTILAGEPSYLMVKDEGNQIISVEGSGQTSSATVTVEIFDMMNNIVTESKDVKFKLLSAPTGTTVNQEIEETIIESANGQAQVSVNAGTEPGNVLLEISLVENPEISITNSDIIIRSGLTDAASFAIGGYDSGENVGGGLWEVEVSVTVTDEYGNPVPDGTAVRFEIESDPDWASILPYGFVGNYNVDGDSTAGVAYTSLTYEGIHSNDELTVIAHVGTGENAEVFSKELVLPMNDITVSATPDPLHIDFHGETPSQPVPNPICELNIVVVDGQGNLIEDCIVDCSSNLGDFITPESDFIVDIAEPWLVKTADITPNGAPPYTVVKAQAKLQFYEEECPPGNPPPGSNQATVNFEVLGTGATFTATIQLWNYFGM